MSQEYLIGVDLGTSGTKTVLFDTEGRTVASATIEYPMYQPQNGWAEQDPADWWNAAKDTIRSVLDQSGVDAAAVRGLGISGQMHGLVMLDEDGNVLRRSIIWCDQRTAAECEEITEKIRRPAPHRNHRQPGAHRLHGLEDPLGAQPRAGDLREVPPHSAAEGLCALHAHRRVRHRGFGRFRHAAHGRRQPLLERRGPRKARHRQEPAL